MIIRDKPNLFKLFFVIHGSIVPKILPEIIVITIISTIVSFMNSEYPNLFPKISITAMTLLGVSLSIFLGFRNNACYDRWWEARKLWGQIIIESRSFSRQILSYIGSRDKKSEKFKKRLVFLTIAFNVSLCHKMRGTQSREDIIRYLDRSDVAKLNHAHNAPDMILRLMSDTLGNCKESMSLSDFLVQSLDDRIISMSTAQAGCERIKNTPLPFAYMLLVQRTAYLYCLLLPFGVVSALGLATPVFCAIVAYTFFGLDYLSGELEDPFGVAANDLALKYMTREIEIELLESIGEKDVPKSLLVKGYKLM